MRGWWGVRLLIFWGGQGGGSRREDDAVDAADEPLEEARELVKAGAGLVGERLRVDLAHGAVVLSTAGGG